MRILLSIFCFLWIGPAWAASTFEIDALNNKHHVTADRTLYHSREKVYEAFGHVVVSSAGQRLSCDYLWLDEDSQDVKARGNVLFVTKNSTMEAAEMHFNLATGVGSIFYGKVANDLYSLKGQLIRKVSDDRFLTTEGEYTTCKDCAESWKLAARNVDMTVDGYAFMDSVFLKIKDVPTLYVPYLIVPVKTKRQSGLLFPRIGGASTHGFVYVQPLFLALSEHQDATLGFGTYSNRGLRYEFEHRYKSYNDSSGDLKFFDTADRESTFATDKESLFKGHRSSLQTNHNWNIAKNLNLRVRAYEVWDRDYVLDFPEDIIGRGLPSLESNVVASAPFDDFFVSAEASRYRNLLYDKATGFDTGTVQALPTIHAGIKERQIVGPLMGSVYARYDSFRRHNGAFYDASVASGGGQALYDPSQDLIRETDRFQFQPVVSAPFRLGDFVSMSPSLQYNETRYSFHVPTARGDVPDTQMRYIQAKLEASTVFERVYAYDGVDVSRLKHQMSPFLTFSNIPWLQQGSTDHPFNGSQGQLQKPAGIFDQFDLVPLTNDTNFLRYPQGKSIYYGFTSRLIRKMRSPDERAPRAYPYDLVQEKPRVFPPSFNRKMEMAVDSAKAWDRYDPHYENYQEVWTVKTTQAYDFKNAESQSDKMRAFSFLLAKSDVNLDRFSHSLEYKFFPRIVVPTLDSAGNSIGETVYRNKQSVSNSFTWYLENLQNLRKTRSFVRSISGNFTNSSHPNPSRTIGSKLVWSMNDFVNFQLAYGYDLLSKNQLDWSAQTILTHHSECWGVALRYDWLHARSPAHANVGFELLLNLLGTGFIGGGDSNGASAKPGGVFGG